MMPKWTRAKRRGEDDDGHNEDTEEPPEMGESTSIAATINR
jgi:hypothetical protein